MLRHHRPVRTATAALTAAVLAFAAAACGSSGGSPAAASATAISSQRCAQNKAAGQITYLSGYEFQSSASILEYVAADKLGYFKDLCLDVHLQPSTGDTAQGTKLLAGGKAQIGAVAEQDLIQARANGIAIEGVSSYSDAGLDILMTNPDITSLTQLDGKIIGDKGYMPASVRAMLVKAGVNWNSLKVVTEGYDPTVLPRHQGGLEALTGFVSNEPNQLADAGHKVTVWQPVKYGVPSSLGAMAVNPAFAAAHPTAVQDMLRAALHAYAYCSASPARAAQCVGYAAALSGPTYDTKLNEQIWSTETRTVADNPTPGQPLGGIDPKNVTALGDMLREFSIIPASVASAQISSWFDDSYIKADYNGNTLIWPAP
ncbi:ABC transporter substrate-binding protein [Actinocrinis puniceicyclus]|uniref:Thiamine pyrimidine synthase n=1 Tax=Actinocrinis puniceicyclus TaxID=977794 RepID=A0A8J8BGB5_9ACTN|nr:ABC transporter substrate-binding protein [Actinocrinis puniceicyclus]MBS2966966.1 ABC transporter substrate-binding protein [Actinocrinis puniceicyclus]